jgi:hypothetical protein
LGRDLGLRLSRWLILRRRSRRGANENPGKGEHRGAHIFFLQFDAGNLQP